MGLEVGEPLKHSKKIMANPCGWNSVRLRASGKEREDPKRA